MADWDSQTGFMTDADTTDTGEEGAITVDMSDLSGPM